MLLQCNSKEEPVVTLGPVTCRWEVFFVCYSSFLSLSVFLLGSEKTPLIRKVVECLWWMEFNPPTEKQKWRYSDVLIFCSECWFPKCKLQQQHMPMLPSHFSFTYLYFQPLSPHQSCPIQCLPSSPPIPSVRAGNDLCCLKIYISFPFSWLNLDLPNYCGKSTLPPLSQSCLQCTWKMDGSLEDRKEAICLRTTLSLHCIWSGVDRVY